MGRWAGEKTASIDVVVLIIESEVDDEVQVISTSDTYITLIHLNTTTHENLYLKLHSSGRRNIKTS